MKRLLLLIISVFSYSQQSSTLNLEYYEGYYLLSSSLPNHYSNLYQFDLIKQEEGNKYKIDVHFNTNTSSDELTDMVVCEVESFILEKDSVYFRSTKCKNEVYEFSGKFLLSADEWGSKDGDVLEGMLYHYIKGKLINKKKVTFEYSPGC